jgi:hypothetical protein
MQERVWYVYLENPVKIQLEYIYRYKYRIYEAIYIYRTMNILRSEVGSTVTGNKPISSYQYKSVPILVTGTPTTHSLCSTVILHNGSR